MIITEQFLRNISLVENDIMECQKEYLRKHGFDYPKRWHKNLLGKDIPDDVAKRLIRFRYEYSISHKKIHDYLEDALSKAEKENKQR